MAAEGRDLGTLLIHNVHSFTADQELDVAFKTQSPIRYGYTPSPSFFKSCRKTRRNPRIIESRYMSHHLENGTLLYSTGTLNTLRTFLISPLHNQ